jgi:SulP family sulfate permease
MNNIIQQYLPIFGWLPGYRRADILRDLIAGTTVSFLLIPQALAYAMLAGLPPHMGLYAAFLPLIIYPIFGTCRHLMVGPVALDSILMAAGIGALATSGSSNYISLTITLTLMVGLLQLLFGFFRLGFMADFLSNPVISGFTSGAAVIIIFSQLKHLLGISMPGSQQIDTLVTYLINNFDQFHSLTFVVGAGSLVVLAVFKYFRLKLPGSLMVVIAGTLAVWRFNLAEKGIQIVGSIPAGFVKIPWNGIHFEDIYHLMPLAFTLAFVSFMESFTIANRIAAKQGYRINADNEMIGLGLANLSSGLIGGYSVAGSFSRTIVNAQNGAVSGMASIITAAIVALTILFLTPLFYYMPRAVFAAIIIAGVFSIIDYREAYRLFQFKRKDFWVLIFAFVSTLFLGIQNGVLVSVVASLIMILHRITRPHIAILGLVPGSNEFRSIQRVPQAQEIPGFLIIRMDASMYFTNINYFRDTLMATLVAQSRNINSVIIESSPINEVDSSAELVLREIAETLQKEHISLYFCNLKGYIIDMFKKSGFYEFLGHEKFISGLHHFIEQHQTHHHY